MQTLEFEAQAKQKEQIINANTERERALIEARTKLEVAKMTLQAVSLPFLIFPYFSYFSLISFIVT